MVGVGACPAAPPGELRAQEAELQPLGQLSMGEAEADEGTAFPQGRLQLRSAQGATRGWCEDKGRSASPERVQGLMREVLWD